MNIKNTTKYDDIIHLPHHVSTKHPQMPIVDRAAQFSPFAALTGHDAAIKETARLTDQRIELDESQKKFLNEKLLLIAEEIEKHPVRSITYFVPDMKKEGGAYVRISGVVKKIDTDKRWILMEEGERIPIDEIIEIESE